MNAAARTVAPLRYAPQTLVIFACCVVRVPAQPVVASPHGTHVLLKRTSKAVESVVGPQVASSKRKIGVGCEGLLHSVHDKSEFSRARARGEAEFSKVHCNLGASVPPDSLDRHELLVRPADVAAHHRPRIPCLPELALRFDRLAAFFLTDPAPALSVPLDELRTHVAALAR